MPFNYEDGTFTEEEKAALQTAEATVEYAMRPDVSVEIFERMFASAQAINVFVLNSRYERLVREREAKKNIFQKIFKK